MDKVESYDYVVVGGGTAGLTVAARLSEDPSITVIVLESGPKHENDPRIMTPGFMTSLGGDPEYDWNIRTVPQAYANKKDIGYTAGRGVGGSSSLNFMMTSYPAPKDFENWVKLGLKNWSWEDILPYFRKFQKYTPKSQSSGETDINLESALLGKTGPIQNSSAPTGPYTDAFFEVTQKVYQRSSTDFLNGSSLGVRHVTEYVDPETKTRSYAASGYYQPKASRPNLHLLTDTHVEKITFGNVEGLVQAEGVLVSSGGKQVLIRARKEVILCAGTIHSPAILERSGIGSTQLLQKHGIEVVVSNEYVGENLQDHPLLPLSREVNDGEVSGDVFRDPAVLAQVIEVYQKYKAGPLADSGMDAIFYAPNLDLTRPDGESTKLEATSDTHSNTPKSPLTQLQYTLLLDQFADLSIASAQYFLLPIQTNTTTSNPFVPTSSNNYITMIAVLEHPFSRGSIHITSSDPRTPPSVDPNFLSHPLDVEVLKTHLRNIDHIMSLEPLRSRFTSNGHPLVDDTPASFKDVEDQVLEDYIRKMIWTQWHPSGTCSMAPKNAGGVVNERFKVYGVEGLRVVDASIVPIQPRGNTASLVYAIAERASDFIREDRK